ncbi:MAG: hypothetical protein B1H03_03830 [Planctomycetales bacterium 4484_113]|nr:MAG: hypothetical protein B1H03_03830 [Planctomycetales bacterium 4484_113]
MSTEDPGGISLDGRVALVIGGSSGLGAMTSRFLLERKCALTITGRAEDLDWKETLPPEQKARIQYVPLTVETGEEFSRLCDPLGFPEPGLSILVYAIGPVIYRSLVETHPHEVTTLMRTNVVGFHSAVRTFLPRFAGDGYGRIVAFTSAGVENLSSKSMAPAYAAAKTALLSLIRSFARELAPRGITVNAIAPGWFAQGHAAPANSKHLPDIPADRQGDEHDLVAALSFLLSPASDYFTGNNLSMSGGYAI